MANTIITKNSSTASSVPTAGDLVQGELAVNVTDKRLFTEDAGGNIVEIGTNPSTINIDAGTIDGTAIGGTTPTTGAFTTLSASTSVTSPSGLFTNLSASGSVTLSGGTANGVPYLNGSKVLTSGSALTFDGNNFGIGGVSNTYGSTYTVATINQSTTGSVLDLNIAGIRTASFFTTASETRIGSVANTPFTFFQNNSEAMRLTSTGLGIGTSSPSQKLEVTGNIKTVGVQNIVQNDNASYALWQDGTPTKAWRMSLASGYNSLFFDYYNGTTWANTATFSPTEAVFNNPGNDYDFRVESNTNTHALFVEGSSGNVGIGTSSPAQKLHVIGSSIIQDKLLLQRSGSSFNLPVIGFYDDLNGATRGDNLSIGNTGSASVIFHTQATERMRIDNAGYVGIGTSSPLYNLHINSGTVNSVAVFESTDATAIIGFKDSSTTNIPSIGAVSDAMIFNTGAAERARIDSSGNLIQTVNTTAATLTTNGTLTFSIVDNSTLRISVRGSDGTTRTATVALS